MFKNIDNLDMFKPIVTVSSFRQTLCCKQGNDYHEKAFADTAQKMLLRISSVNVQRIWSHLLKKSLVEKFIFCAV